VELPVRLCAEGDVDEAKCLIHFSYLDSKGVQRVLERAVELPVLRFFKLISPVKDSSMHSFLLSEFIG